MPWDQHKSPFQLTNERFIWILNHTGFCLVLHRHVVLIGIFLCSASAVFGATDEDRPLMQMYEDRLKIDRFRSGKRTSRANMMLPTCNTSSKNANNAMPTCQQIQKHAK